MSCRIDHIAVVADSLEAGSEFVFQCLGVRPRQGGKHPRMGTHNRLLRLGDGLFLEVIAIDPAAPAPARPRWFGFDTLPVGAAPRLAFWVARVDDDIHQALADAPEALGVAEPMTRGELQWLISIPENGSLPLDGVAPALIHWHAASHPALAMEDQGCRLVALELLHPEPERVDRLLASLAVAEPGVGLSVTRSGVAGLVATLRTPQGLRTIGGPAGAAGAFAVDA
ncbi:MAG: VOC family protein [Burkholderiaceae bacterium]